MSGKGEIDELSGVQTTGHEWDGIKELNNPLPGWWRNTFYLTVLFAIVYTVLYPAWPGITGNTKGIWGWSSRGDLRTSMEQADAAHADVEKAIAGADMKTILADSKLKAYAVSAGGAAFKTYCTQCHGSGAQGAVGYPNLNDDEWIWGGTPDQILATISHGARFTTDNQTHASQMPAFGKDGILKADQITDVANYVLKISGQKADEAHATAGQKVFTENCAACHGDAGQGNADVGAPPLNNQIWLYGGTMNDIVAQVTNPRHGVMPAWQPRLGDLKVKELAAYVVSLGGSK